MLGLFILIIKMIINMITFSILFKALNILFITII